MKFHWLRKIAVMCFGFLLTAIILEVGLRAAGSVLFYLQHKGNARVAEDGMYRILCVGESTTARGGQDSWPAQLEQVLNSKSDKIRFRVFNEGCEGIDTNYILSRIAGWLDLYRPDMVVSMMGINDKGELEANYNIVPVPEPSFFDRFRIYRLCRVLYDRIGALLAKRDFFQTESEFVEPENESVDNEIKPFFAVGAEDDVDVPAVSEPERDASASAQELDVLKNAVLSSPDDISAHLRLAVWFREQGKLDDAEKIIALAEKTDSAADDDRLFIEKANLSAARGDLNGAEEFYRRALSINPDYDGTYLDLGLCLRKMDGRGDEAEEMFKACINRNPENYDALEALSRIYYEKEDFVNFEQTVLKGLELRPGDIELSGTLVEYYKKNNRFDEAERLLETVCLNNPQDVFCYIKWASFFRERGNGPAGLDVCLRAEKIFPDVPELLLEKAFCLFGIERTDDALNCFSRILDASSSSKRGLLILEIAGFLFNAGYFEEADFYARTGLESGLHSGKFYFLLALTAEALYKAEEFETFLNKAAENGADGLDVKMAFARLNIAKQKYSLAEKIFLECLDSYPGYEVHIISSLAEMYSLEQAYSEATRRKMETLFERLHKLRENNPALFLRYSGESGVVKLCAFGARYFRERGNRGLADEYYVFARNQRMRTFCRTTKENYRKLKAVLDEHAVMLVCMQYPMRSIIDLKKLFDAPETMFFVENKDNFLHAFERREYKELFADHFGGDFGHATGEGNLVIAQNLASRILEIIRRTGNSR